MIDDLFSVVFKQNVFFLIRLFTEVLVVTLFP